MIWFLATEDQLSSELATHIIQQVLPAASIAQDLGQTGNGKLKADLQAGKFTKLAKLNPVFLLTDLDQAECAPTLRKAWLQANAAPNNLLFRIAVREAEAWLMADTVAFTKFTGIGKGKIPRDLESVRNPKELMPKASPSYNAVLCNFVQTQWNAERAAENAPSLQRAMERVRGVG